MNDSNVIEINGLSKYFGSVHAVDSVHLHVKRGEIYGFLGLNGAGKTTTIRALLGMIRPDAGSVRVLGESVGPNGRGPWRRVGHLIEAPSAYPELTVMENLKIAALLHGISDKNAVSRIIESLGLASYSDIKAGTLSTGNLQRLGLARSMLHEPELLILDEPANGLDPAGVVEIRKLLSGLAQRSGVTIFMSSHILTEVDRLAARIGIIHEGRLLEELDSRQLEAIRAHRLEIETRNMPAAKDILTQAGFDVKTEGDRMILMDEKAVEAPDKIAAVLVKAGHPPLRLAVEKEDLEDHFLRLTGAKE